MKSRSRASRVVTLYLRLARLPGQEFVDVLEVPEEEERQPTGIVESPLYFLGQVPSSESS